MSTGFIGAERASARRPRADVALVGVGVALTGLVMMREGAPAPVLSSSALLIGAVFAALIGLRVADRWSPLAALAALGVLIVLLWTHGPAPQTLGDDWYWGYWNEGLGRPRHAWTSTLLPSVVVAALGPASLTALNIPLALGTIAALAWMAHTLVPFAASGGRAVSMAVVVFVLFGLPLVHGEDYHEMYPLAVFAAVLASAWIMRWWRAAPTDGRDVAIAGVLSALALLSHLVMVGVAVLGAAVLWTCAGAARVRSLAVFAASIVATGLAVLVAIVVGGFDLVEGNSLGATGGPLATGLLSLSHGRGAVLNALWVAAAPATVLAAVAVRTRTLGGLIPILLPAAIPLALLALWGFDYGFPQDVDLMVTAMVVAIPGVVGAIGLAARDAVAAVRIDLLVAAMAVAVAVAQSGFLVTTGEIPTGVIVP